GPGVFRTRGCGWYATQTYAVAFVLQHAPDRLVHWRLPRVCLRFELGLRESEDVSTFLANVSDHSVGVPIVVEERSHRRTECVLALVELVVFADRTTQRDALTKLLMCRG